MTAMKGLLLNRSHVLAAVGILLLVAMTILVSCEPDLKQF